MKWNVSPLGATDPPSGAIWSSSAAPSLRVSSSHPSPWTSETEALRRPAARLRWEEGAWIGWLVGTGGHFPLWISHHLLLPSWKRALTSSNCRHGAVPLEKWLLQASSQHVSTTNWPKISKQNKNTLEFPKFLQAQPFFFPPKGSLSRTASRDRKISIISVQSSSSNSPGASLVAEISTMAHSECFQEIRPIRPPSFRRPNLTGWFVWVSYLYVLCSKWWIDWEKYLLEKQKKFRTLGPDAAWIPFRISSNLRKLKHAGTAFEKVILRLELAIQMYSQGLKASPSSKAPKQQQHTKTPQTCPLFQNHHETL